MNLYGFVFNSPNNVHDPLGQSAAEIADKFDGYYYESVIAMDMWVENDPCYVWVVTASVKTVMDIGRGTVDILRFGEGIAEGGLDGFVKDILRGISIASSIGALTSKAVQVLKLQLIEFAPIKISGKIVRTQLPEWTGGAAYDSRRLKDIL